MARFLVCLAFLSLGRLIATEVTNKGWWKETVFYQIYPRSFKDDDGDGVGDLKGITAKMEHFVDAGVGAIWLSPIYTSPMVDFGYDIADFRDIDPVFGNIADFEALAKKARALKLKVILDFVPNHTSDKHTWFEKSVNREFPYDNYYVWHPGNVDDDGNRLPPNNWISVFSGPAWTFNEERGQWYFHQFAKEQPDLNYYNVLVQEEMKDVLRFWLSKGVDGFRIDAIPHLVEVADLADEPPTDLPNVTSDDYRFLDHIYTKDHELTYKILQDWRNVLDVYASETNSEEKVLMTEAYTNLTNTLKYYDYGSQIPFNFEFIMGISGDSTPEDFKEAIDLWLDEMPGNGVANWVMGNHDRSRTASRFPGRSDQMTMLAMILPGIAITYNGEEIAMIDTPVSWEETQDPQACNTNPDVYEAFSRDPNRSPFQWDATTSAGFSTNATTWIPVNENYLTLNLERQKTSGVSHYKVYQALTALRKEPVLRRGSNNVRVIENEILAVTRALNEGGITRKVTLLINFDDNDEKSVDLIAADIAVSSDLGKIYTSSVESNVATDEYVDVANVKLPAKASLVVGLVSRSGAAVISGSIFIVVFFFFFLFTC